MKTVSLLEFRKNAEKIIRCSRQGQKMVMTYRGRPVMRLEPILDETIAADDPFLLLDGIATGGKENMSNRQMDDIIYEK